MSNQHKEETMSKRKPKPKPKVDGATAPEAPARKPVLAIAHNPDPVMPPLNEPLHEIPEPKAHPARPRPAPQAEAMANNTAALGALATLANAINTAWDAAQGAEARAFDKRLEAAIKLAQAKEACANAPTPIPFQGWVEAHVQIAYETARAMARIGAADDPAAALRAERDRSKRGQAEIRARRASEPRSDAAGAARPESEALRADTDAAIADRATPWQRADNALTALGVGAVELCWSHLGRHNADPRAGMREQVEAAEAEARAVQPAEPRSLATVGALKAAFAALARDDQGEFLLWAMEAFQPEKREGDGANASADPFDIPAFLRRKPEPPTVN